MAAKVFEKDGYKPLKIKYYLEKKDPEFENKMHEVLLVYKHVEIQFSKDVDIIAP